MAARKPPAPGPDQSRNEYIPSFISKRPFWAESTHDNDTDYLEHQRLQSAPKDTLDKAKWYDGRGRKLGPAATKFRKGACENCGAMTHKTKECLSRPRKSGAKWTGQDIQADEVVDDVSLGWDAKRDRWNGYDAREYTAVVKEYEELEALKKSTSTPTNGTAEDDNDARYAEETDMGRSQPTSTRQLRLREDTAAYLKNLDLESAHYDPKTRSMDKNALPPGNDEVDVSEGFTRPAATTDDAAEFERAQKYAWETQESTTSNNQKLHLQANPTEGEILRKKQTLEAAERKALAKKALLDRYGESAAQPAHKRLKTSNISANERYVEYDSTGQIKGVEKTVAKSKYPEDIFTNNHTSVWGSWWKNFTWGYACCHSTVKNSYCTGEEGRRAWEDTEGMRTGKGLLLENGESQVEAAVGEEKERLRLEQNGEDVSEWKDVDVADTTAEKARPTSTVKKRTLQEIQSGILEEELEAYKRNRLTADDPMAKMLGRDEVLEMS
jgi:pre-mRNA-processing factor SLU7